MNRHNWREIAEKLQKENDELKALINNPQIDEFWEAVKIEAAHQKHRWGSVHDSSKTPLDWLWLIGYLATKAVQAERYKDFEKYLHHIITVAAVCYNWHTEAAKKIGEKDDIQPTRL